MTPMRRSRTLALAACLAVLASSVGYAFMLQQQDVPGTSPWAALHGAPTWFLAILAAAIAATAIAVGLHPSRGRRLLLLAACTVLFGVGFVAIFSIGMPLLLAAAFTLAAALSDESRTATTAVR
jgi:hypothetical protein